MKYHTLFRWTFAIAGALVLWLANAAPATAQQRGTIRGTVREASSQRPVASVEVFIPGTQMRTTTDAQGAFELTGVPAGGAQVRVRAPGYSSALATTMVVGGQSVTVDFALNTSVVALDEVVVTGTGATQARKQLGNTIATVRADVVEAAPVRNFSEAIAAREAGVSILPSSGVAGEGSRIRIRGNASLSQNNEPVVYVDGVRIAPQADHRPPSLCGLRRSELPGVRVDDGPGPRLVAFDRAAGSDEVDQGRHGTPALLSEQMRDMREDIFEGLLSNDIVGFHTRAYRRNFLLCCRELFDLPVNEEAGVVDFEGREVWVRAYPLPISADSFMRKAQRQEVHEYEREILRRRRDHLILRVTEEFKLPIHADLVAEAKQFCEELLKENSP